MEGVIHYYGSAQEEEWEQEEEKEELHSPKPTHARETPIIEF